MIESLKRLIPPCVRVASLRAFYSGSSAFEQKGGDHLYGLNPVGSLEPSSETVAEHGAWVASEARADRSAFIHEDWGGKPSGAVPLRFRFAYLLDAIAYELRKVAASNAIFWRSRREESHGAVLAADIAARRSYHFAAIEKFELKVVLCMGRTALEPVARWLGVRGDVGKFPETNRGQWCSTVHRTDDGPLLVRLSHPGVADWCMPASDPTPMLARSLTL